MSPNSQETVTTTKTRAPPEVLPFTIRSGLSPVRFLYKIEIALEMQNEIKDEICCTNHIGIEIRNVMPLPGK